MVCAIPREAATMVVQPTKRVIFVTDEAGEYIKEGKSVLMPGVVSVSLEIAIGDSVFVMAEGGECVAVGRAKMSYAEAKGTTRGQLVRIRQTQKPVI